MRKTFGKYLRSILAIAIFCAVSVPVLAQFGVPELVGLPGSVALLYGLSKLPRPSFIGFVHVAGIQVEIWQDHIEGNLFKNNQFLLSSVDASQYVLLGKIVHIPQAQAGLATVEKDRSSLPATVVTRTDTDVNYSLHEYTTDPILIPNADNYDLSYNKRESVLSEYEASLRQVTADNILVDWSPSRADRMIRTTGATTATHLDGTTGDRKKFTVNDLKNAANVLNKQNVPMENRYCLMSADMYQQFTDELTVTQQRDFSATYDPSTGVVGKMFGFSIYMRSAVVSYTNAATPVVNAYGAEANEDDNDAVLCWQMNAVERALGSIKFFEQMNSPQYYGDIYSLLVRMGSRKRRTLEEGLVAIIQDAAN